MTQVKRLKPSDLADAEALFLASGERDFRYVMLALGSAPANPPQWAIDAARIAASKEQDHPHFIVKSFGADPASPPAWAVEKMMTYADGVRHDHVRQVGHPDRTGHLLDQMFRRMFAHFQRTLDDVDGEQDYASRYEEVFRNYLPPEVRKVARAVLQADDEAAGRSRTEGELEAQIKNLERAWNDEAKGAVLVHGMPDTIRRNIIAGEGDRGIRREIAKRIMQGQSRDTTTRS